MEERTHDKHTVYVYTIIRSGVDEDRGSFPAPCAEVSFFSRDNARDKLAELIAEEKANLDPRYDHVEEDEDFWEASEDGYAAAHFTRLEIVSSVLSDGIYAARSSEDA